MAVDLAMKLNMLAVGIAFAFVGASELDRRIVICDGLLLAGTKP